MAGSYIEQAESCVQISAIELARLRMREKHLSEIFRICGIVYDPTRPVRDVIDQILEWNEGRIEAEQLAHKNDGAAHHFQAFCHRFGIKPHAKEFWEFVNERENLIRRLTEWNRKFGPKCKICGNTAEVHFEEDRLEAFFCNDCAYQ